MDIDMSVFEILDQNPKLVEVQRQRVTYGKELDFGKYKGMTIEQIIMMDPNYLVWVMDLPSRGWIAEYLSSMPRIFPRKIKIVCGENHHQGCKTEKATYFSVPVDRGGSRIIELGAACFWCDQCYGRSAGYTRDKYSILSLDFSTGARLRHRNDKVGFFEIMKRVYGIGNLTQKAAYELFWE